MVKSIKRNLDELDNNLDNDNIREDSQSEKDFHLKDAYELKEDIKVDFFPKKENNLTEVSPRKIWGQLVLSLRQKNLMTLHSACGEIRDITLTGDTLFVNVKDEFTYKILTKPENSSKIDLELKQINDKITLKFNLKVIPKSKIERNILVLRELFGDEIKIK